MTVVAEMLSSTDFVAKYPCGGPWKTLTDSGLPPARET